MASDPELFEYIGFFEAEPEVLMPEVGSHWCEVHVGERARSDNRCYCARRRRVLVYSR
jgi:hypothetical protein